MATIKEISEKANVSIATVSKVLNGKGRVSDETRKMILNIADEMNYHPNLYARNLQAGSSHTIGIITEDLTVFNAPEIVDGIANICDSVHYHYILGNLRLYKLYGNGPRDDKKVRSLTQEVVDHMLSNQVDGIIYIGCHSHLIMTPTDHHGAKFVYAYCLSADKTIPSVVYNEEKAAYEATNILLKKENVKLGTITGPSDSIHSANRARGFQKALFENRIVFDPSLSLVGDWNKDCGYKLGKQLISKGVNAIFVHNDLMAAGVLDYCNEVGLDAKKEINIIGFDNREIAKASRPSLSTIQIPLFEIGQEAARQMFSLLKGGSAPHNHILLDCTIIERDTTKNIRID